MKFVAISDVHIKEPKGNSEELFLKFLNSKETQSSDEIFLLGDIFDLLVGGHKEYLEKYRSVFERLVSLANEGKVIHQCEGNHDFHFQRLIEEIKDQYSLPERAWVFHKEPWQRRIGEKSFFFAHGDEIEIENEEYQRYRKLIRSSIIYKLTNFVVPFQLVDWIGRTASQKSREHNKSRYSSDSAQEIVRSKFRRTFSLLRKEHQFDYLICGHSHCQDLFEEAEAIYSNNGYFPITQSFHWYDGAILSHASL